MSSNDFLQFVKAEPERFLLIDASNVMYRCFHVHKEKDAETLIAIAYHTTLSSINSMYNKFKPTRVILAFDRENWRKRYTKSEQCVSQKVYKGQRRQNMSPSDKERYKLFMEFVADFETLLRERTGITCLSCDGAEGDDIIAGVVQMFAPEVEIVIVSQDNDLEQLMRYDNVRIYDPKTKLEKKRQTIEEIEYALFLKCFRGEIGDNVQSAYPKLRETKIKAAFTDPFALTTLLETTWTGPDQRVMKVGDLFAENQLLVDLTRQPDDVKAKMYKAIDEGMEHTGRYSHFHFLRFMGQYKLENLAKRIDSLIPLLQGRH